MQTDLDENIGWAKNYFANSVYKEDLLHLFIPYDRVNPSEGTFAYMRSQILFLKLHDGHKSYITFMIVQQLHNANR